MSITDAKRRVLERLKRVDAATVPELAASLGLTEAAVRQHLDALEHHGFVTRRGRPTGTRGRPPAEWSLTPLAAELFPDRHEDLTLELVAAIREAVGEAGLDAVVAAREARQLAAYREIIPAPDEATLRRRVAALARQRTAEGYMAEVRPDGDAVLLVEHHCPVCSAATACTGLCRGELDLFRAVLGDDVEVERIQHLLAGDARCVYRLRDAAAGSRPVATGGG
ncbi:MAG TPA: helix-turn-helix domain-containing protein [Acidimicrobiia bacterium]|nr:helix-turn-helix domain-containing protein [Acidimicrobiia bacterium]